MLLWGIPRQEAVTKRLHQAATLGLEEQLQAKDSHSGITIESRGFSEVAMCLCLCAT